MEKEIFLVEELENRLAAEAILYLDKVEELWGTNKFDPIYFGKLLAGRLYGEFVNLIHDRIRPLNSHEANRYLTLSFTQFKTHTPDKREKDFWAKYWQVKWSQNNNGDEVLFDDKKYVKHIWTHYTNQFKSYKEETEKALDDYKAGILGSQPTQSNTNLAIPDPIRYEAYRNYLNQFKYNYPYLRTVFDFKYSMRDYLDYLKTEILDNLITLSKDDRRVYLNKLKYELENNKQHAYTSQETIDEWLTKYNVESEEAIMAGNKNNTLYTILTSDVPEFEAEFAEDYNRDTHGIQTDFYNFYYGFYLDTAIAFIIEQINELNPLQILSSNSSHVLQPVAAIIPKLKTNLSVPQLAYLFKALMDLNPPIFDIKTKKELYLFIESNFTTKGKDDEGPTFKKLNNLYSDVDKSVAVFWAEKFKKMLEEARKV